MSSDSPVPPDEELDASLYPIAILLDELKHENPQLRLNATRRIKTIAEALGPERTRGELLPFITETIDDEDDVILTLAEELGDFLAEVGGSQYAAFIAQPLEALCTVEETIIRDRAIESLIRLGTQVSSSSEDDSRTLHIDYMFPLFMRLSTGDWFTSRISACALSGDIYKRLPVDREDLRTQMLSRYIELAHDETPMVRRAAASYIANFASSVYDAHPTYVSSELFPVYCDLVEDDQDSVRLLIVEATADFVGLLERKSTPLSGDTLMSSEGNGALPVPQDQEKKEEGTTEAAGSSINQTETAKITGENGAPTASHDLHKILEIVKGFGLDKSWRVRYIVADRLSDLCDSLGHQATRTDLLPAFVSLLKDNEAEVRTSASFKVSEMVKRIVALPSKPGDISGLDFVVNDILPLIEQLITDTSQNVRTALASSIMTLASVLRTESNINRMVDVVLVLLQDDYPDVRLNVISRLDKVSTVMSMDRLIKELLPAVVELAEDKNWRVRLGIIKQFPILSKQLGKDYFENNKKLGELCINWLGDCVYAIREGAIRNLKLLTDLFGLEWAKEYIVPHILQMYDRSANYLLRVTSLHAIGVLSEVLNTEIVEEAFLPIVTDRASRDPVPNVRFCSAKTLNLVIPYVGQDIRESKIRPCLMNLVDSSEKDKDVNYFAQEALHKLGTCPS